MALLYSYMQVYLFSCKKYLLRKSILFKYREALNYVSFGSHVIIMQEKEWTVLDSLILKNF